MIPGLKLGTLSREEVEHRAMEKLKIFDMQDHALKKANQLSGGQKQRVAIARALAANPKVLLADEPTGALDSKTSYEVMELLQGINDEGKTLLIVTHETDIAQMTKRIVYLKDGLITEDKVIQQQKAILHV